MDCNLSGFSDHGIFPGKNTGVGCHFLLQGIFPTQGLNLCLPHCREMLYHQSHQGSPWKKKLWQICSVLCLVTQSSLSFCDLVDCNPPGSPVHGYSPVRKTGVGCHALLQGIFPAQGSNLHLLHLLHWQAGSLLLVPPGKPTQSIESPKQDEHKHTHTKTYHNENG